MIESYFKSQHESLYNELSLFAEVDKPEWEHGCWTNGRSVNICVMNDRRVNK
jgi:hypothetical protein